MISIVQKNRWRVFKETFLLCVLVVHRAFAGGGGGGMIVYDPTNWIQNVSTAANTAQGVEKQVEALQTQAQQYQVELNNARTTKQYVWSDISNILANLSNTIQTGNAVAYSMADVDQKFQQAYPGYSPSQNYAQEYQQWSSTSMDTIRGVLDSTSMSFQNFQTQEQTVNTLRGLANNPTGQMQSIEAGTMIAGQTANELLTLQQLVMAQTNSQTAYQAYKVQTDQATQGSIDQALTNADDTFPKYNDADGFGPIPNFNH